MWRAAEIVGRTPAACRQLATSARRRLRASHAPATPEAEQSGIVADFKRAWDARDIGALARLLDPAVTAVADGGGVVSAAPHPLEGDDAIARYAIGISAKAPGLVLRERTVNGRLGLIGQQGGATVMVIAFAMARGRITHLWAVRNPENLRAWTGIGGSR